MFGAGPDNLSELKTIQSLLIPRNRLCYRLEEARVSAQIE